MTHSRKFRLGLVGAGGVAVLHADAAAALPDVEVTAVCDPRLEAAGELASRTGALAFSSHTAMFRSCDLDGVVVTAPHTLHAPITVDAARHGLHVLVEKPMATSVSDCLLMIDACRQYGVRLGVGHVVHFLPGVIEARRILTSGELGVPLTITERRTAHYSPGSRPAWFFDRSLAGGGIVMNVGIHSIDKAQWLGAAPATRVLGHVAQKPGMSVETEALAMLQLQNGVRVSLSLAGTGLPFQDETEIVCEQGALRLSRRDGVWIYRESEEVQLLPAAESEIGVAFGAQLEDFVEACRDDREPAVSGAYGQSVIATAIAIYESSASGEQIAVPHLGELVQR
ncbi:Gfo/Idh/MocA family protein [Kribbella sp. CA-293567]|uniref:Gfo/Idh/MocA family protein n=1 Tax=Kribbella sp. CA-293567 TaxID=3002436 RepID=UPI0022DDF947|nr:Gfo/Idh/MocA family oxidoreductase [Kribbella sp. CA-293567]WBQ03907.1 Gfo/Idh/MocA family oxidoreductase [Kribbella sp. CA-293567]